LKKNKSICFLVNGNYKIGLGHVYRCLTISTESNKRGVSTFFIIPNIPVLKNFLTVNKAEFKTVENVVWENPKLHKTEFAKHLLNVDIVLLDLLEEQFFKFYFLSKINIKIASIISFYYSEDNRYEDICFFPGIEVKEKLFIQNKNNKTKLLSGPKYLTFRKEFCKKFEKEFNEEVPEILITMGGTDAFGFSLIAVKSLLDLDIDYKATIIMGAGALTLDEVNELVFKKPNIKIESNVNNIAQLMHSSTIALINGGLTRYELAITGTPFIALSIHDIQYKITERITSVVGGVNLGVVEDIKKEDITYAVKKLILDIEKRKLISYKLQELIDSEGTERILNCLESL